MGLSVALGCSADSVDSPPTVPAVLGTTTGTSTLKLSITEVLSTA